MVPGDDRVARGLSFHNQKFVYRRICQKTANRRGKTLNTDQPSRFQRIFVDCRVRRTQKVQILIFRVGFERNVVVKFRP